MYFVFSSDVPMGRSTVQPEAELWSGTGPITRVTLQSAQGRVRLRLFKSRDLIPDCIALDPQDLRAVALGGLAQYIVKNRTVYLTKAEQSVILTVKDMTGHSKVEVPLETFVKAILEVT
jgi:hypothetical protein